VSEQDRPAEGAAPSPPAAPQPPPTTTLLLIRHGANDWVGSHRLAGWTPGVHLNAHGQRQAQAIADRLANEKIAAIYSSPLERTLETAEPLARALNLPIRIREGIGEVRYGDWTGRSVKELAEQEAATWHVIQTAPSRARFPNGEGLYEMQARAVQELDAIARAHPGETVAVISHADIIRACVAHYLGMHLDLFQRLVIEPGSLTVLRLSPLGVAVVRVNDVCHLPPEPTPAATTEEAAPSPEPPDSPPPAAC